jgi:site-specific DNA recombinase
MPDISPTTKAPRRKTAVLYARFSSDLQKDRSIDDQLAICRAHADREGLNVTATFCDRAKSGASLFDRDGLLELMTRAKERGFDAVVVESLDRISRDQEDLAGIFKRLSFFGVDILTVNEGKTTSIHVGIRGLVGSLFLADLGNKVRRGHAGRVREGKFPGAVTYGYSTVPGKPGERAINEAEAKIVRRIFAEYADGRSPRGIAEDLNRDGIPTPGGGKWNMHSFVTGRLRRGMISNPIYSGRLVWNSSRTALNPDTGRKVKVTAPADDKMEMDVPHLRIIDEKTWTAAQELRQGRSFAKFGRKGWVARRPVVPRNERLLAGLLRCGVCGGQMRIAQKSRDGSSRVACASAHGHSACQHRKSYDLAVLESAVLDQMREHLTDPRMITEAARGFHDQWAEDNKRKRAEQSDVQRQIRNLQVKIDRIVDAIENSDLPVKGLVEKMNRYELERVGLAERLRLMEAESNVIDIHPRALAVYAENIEKLHKAFAQGEQTAANRTAFRNVVDSVVIHQTPKRARYEFSVYGRLGALLGVDLFPTLRTASQMIEEQSSACSDRLATANPVATLSQHAGGQIILLGRWRQAA